MSLFSKLFGGGGGDDGASAKSAPEPVVHEGFRIYADPIREGGQHRIAARIEKEIDGTLKTHRMIRADTLGDRDAAVTATLAKARALIDEQGERIFG